VLLLGKFIASEDQDALHGGSRNEDVTAFLTVEAKSRSVGATMAANVDFNSSRSKSGRISRNGPTLQFTFAVPISDLANQRGWVKLPVVLTVLDERATFSITEFLFSGPNEERQKYGLTFLDAVCQFLGQIYVCPAYPAPKSIKWDLLTSTSPGVDLHELPLEERTVLANNSHVLHFLRRYFSDAGDGVYIKKLR
jgi:hypothetical protein